MNFGVIAATLSLGLTVALAPAASDTAAPESQRAPDTRLAQANPGAAGSATTNNLQGIGLTASHKRIIYDNIASEQAQTLSGDPQLAVGEHHSQFAHAQYDADRGEGSDRPVKGFQVRQANGRQYPDRRSSQPGDHGHHHQARSRTIERACSSHDNSSLCKHAPGCRQFRREHLVHATAIEIDNLKAPAIHVEAIAHRW